MKVIQIVTQMEGGGAQRVAYLLHKAFLDRGYEAELWFLYLKRPAYAGKVGVRVLCESRPSAWECIALCGKLFRWIRAYRPDVVITHTHYANVLGQTISALAGVNCRLAVQHNLVETYPGFAREADRILGTIGVYTAQVAVSDAVVNSMSAYPVPYRNRVHRIFNGTTSDDEASGLHSTFQLKSPALTPTLLHVGRFSKAKNHEALLEMMLLLPEADLFLAGDGERRAEIEALVTEMKLEDRVHFLGEITPQEVRSAMRSCDLFVFPSLYEGMPMVLLEAMAAGKPIVASDISSNREVLSDAAVLTSANPSDLAQVTARLLADRNESTVLSQKAAERAKRFTASVMADNYERLFPGHENDSRATPPPEAALRFPSFHLSGVRVHAITKSDLIAIIAYAIQEKAQCIIGNHNLHGLYCWFRDPKAREFHEMSEYTHIDGMSIVLMGRLLGLPLKSKHRTGYMDFLPVLAEASVNRKWRIFYLGSKPGVAKEAATKLCKLYPGLDICTHHGHFDTERNGKENQDVLAKIRAYSPHVLLVGMGMPRQETWIVENRTEISANAVFCSGALMDYVAGVIPTPPRWVGAIGLEWMYRLLSEPTRLWRRYLVEPWFVFGQITRHYVKDARTEGRAETKRYER